MSVRQRNAESDARQRQEALERIAAQERALAEQNVRKATRDAFVTAQLMLDSMWAEENATPGEIREVNNHIALTAPKSFGDVDLHRAKLWALRASKR